MRIYEQIMSVLCPDRVSSKSDNATLREIYNDASLSMDSREQAGIALGYSSIRMDFHEMIGRMLGKFRDEPWAEAPKKRIIRNHLEPLL
jgi:hypothetical protein